MSRTPSKDQESRKFTEKQEAFVAAYIGEANYNATKAARIAGYALPKQSGTECLANPIIKARIREHLDSITDQGIANRAVRVAKLNDLYSKIEDLVEKEGIHQEAYTNQGRQYKTFAKEVLSEMRAIMEQAAKEVGDRDKRIQLEADIKVDATSAKDALLDLIQEDSDSE